ncbi:LADA_0A05270g1_1 [Lachancea dasiensis]|uniref:LADA_0A05270g1_1 n=1 Tax=Lachancea dasiensis TaxID=1072105 RepID=A0A1G4IPG2_9SACH|nr:LADA_0A05270g1_1 [Lachancea dasiensis]
MRSARDRSSERERVADIMTALLSCHLKEPFLPTTLPFRMIHCNVRKSSGHGHEDPRFECRRTFPSDPERVHSAFQSCPNDTSREEPSLARDRVISCVLPAPSGFPSRLCFQHRRQDKALPAPFSSPSVRSFGPPRPKTPRKKLCILRAFDHVIETKTQRTPPDTHTHTHTHTHTPLAAKPSFSALALNTVHGT